MNRSTYVLSVLVLLMLLVIPVALATSLGFSSSPAIVGDVTNFTTNDPFHCRFTPLGSGSLTANVSWYVDDVFSSSQTLPVSNATSATSDDIDTTDTQKGQDWYCSVLLSNTTENITQNSSTITIENSLPVIIEIGDQTAYEDSSFSLQMDYTDADNDSVSWSSTDLNRSDYGEEQLFIITSDGLISFLHTNETLVGNHTMKISADDGDPNYEARIFVNFEFFAVNDLPTFTSSTLSNDCVEASVCSGTILATDEEDDTLNFTANESFINLQEDGSYSFIPSYVQALVGEYLIQINLSDGTDVVVDYLNLSINLTNHEPNVSYSNLSATQNDVEFYFTFNATDPLDSEDFFNFTLETDCAKTPWTPTLLSNGSNSTTAVLEINQSLDSNEFVECRNFTITVNEFDSDPFQEKGTYEYDVALNITNVNDPPVLHNLSYYEQNIQNDIHNLTGAYGLSFTYLVNATDVDMLTYQGDSLTYSLSGVPQFPGGQPLFVINSSTGVITSAIDSMNDSYLGNQSFLVTVTDSNTPTYNDSQYLNVSIAVNYAPQIYVVDNSSCVEEMSCLKYIAGNDTEGSQLELLLTNLSYTNPLNVTNTNYSSSEIATLLGINLTPVFAAGISNFSLDMSTNDSEVGLYVLNFTLRDDVGVTNSSWFSFNVTNVNEPPRLDNNSDHSTFENITFGIFAEMIPFFKNIYGFDEDLTYGLDNLTYNYSFIGPVLGNFSVVRVNSTLAYINFTPPPYDVGNFTVNITVFDAQNLSESQVINFTVYDRTEFPNITAVKPYFNTQLNSTFLTMTPLDGDESNTSISVTENDSVTFDITAQDKDNQSMTVYWYVEGVLNETVSYDASTGFDKRFTFFENGTLNLSLQVWDIGYDEFTWFVTVEDLNRPPLHLNDLINYTGAYSISGQQTIFNFFMQNSEDIIFIDPDDDLNSDNIISGDEQNTLNFSVNASGSCDELASFSFSGGNLTIVPSESGNCSTSFIATDTYGLTVTSNTIRMNIIRIEGSDEQSTSSSSSATQTVTQTITVPLEEEVEVPEWFTMIIPGIVSLYENGTVTIPLQLKNPLEETISAISLKANTSAENVSFQFSENYVDSIAPGGSVFLNLTASRYRADAPFEVNVSGYISSLDYTDYATVYINALEKGAEDLNSLQSKLSFARDLLNDNPECNELYGLLLQAENKFASDNATSSLEIVNGVINGCKYLINEGIPSSDALPRSFIGKLGLYSKEILNYRLLGIVLGSLLVVAIAAGIFVRLHLRKI